MPPWLERAGARLLRVVKRIDHYLVEDWAAMSEPSDHQDIFVRLSQLHRLIDDERVMAAHDLAIEVLMENQRLRVELDQLRAELERLRVGLREPSRARSG